MPDLTIAAVEAIPFAIPYRKPLRFASGVVDSAEHVLVRVTSADGLVGHAEAPPRPYTYGETQASIIAAIDTLFAPAIIGTSALARERLRAALHRTTGNHTAKASLDMALWDIIGQSLGQPVSALLGGWGDTMRVCHMLGLDEPDVMVDEALRMREQYGITTFKVKVGRDPYLLDVAVCRALRQHLGDDIASAVKPELMLDPKPAPNGQGVTLDYGFTLDPVH